MGKQIDWDKVAELSDKIREQGLSLAEGAKLFGIPVWRLYELSRRKERSPESNDGGDSVQEQDNPHAALLSSDSGSQSAEVVAGGDTYTLSSLPTEVQQLIIGYRTGEVGVGFKRIEDRLKSDHLVVVSRKQIRQVLKNHGLLDEHDSSFDLPAQSVKGSRRFEAAAAGEMFQQYLDDQRIEHLVGNPHSPQSQGKVERLIQTLKREWLGRTRFAGLAEAVTGLAAYIRGYNYDRPHQGIGGFRPADRFYGVESERSRIEAELTGREIDFSKGYCIFKAQENSVSVVSSAAGIAVYLNGKLLKEADDEHNH